jgi:hypothetical protein
MDMKRFLFVATLVLAGSVISGCNKPSETDCRAAITNMEKLLGTEAAARNVDNEGEVRRCRGGSTKQAVACAAKATSVDELKACAFMSPKSAAPSATPSASPSATPGSGSAEGSNPSTK